MNINGCSYEHIYALPPTYEYVNTVKPYSFKG